MNRLGKVTIGLVLAMMLAIGVTWMATYEVKAATIASRTFVLPSSSSVTHSANTYIILWDRATGDLVADAGTVEAGNTWTGGDIATAVHAENGTVYTATIPALSDAYRYAMAIYDAASPAKTDVPTMGPFLYNAKTGAVFSDTNPIYMDEVETR